MITWGGPIATFRWDSAKDVDFKFMSVREINGEEGPSLIQEPSPDTSSENGSTVSKLDKSNVSEPDKEVARGNESEKESAGRQIVDNADKGKIDDNQSRGVEHGEKNSSQGTKSSIANKGDQESRRSKDPQVAIYGDNLHVVWEDNSTGNSEIYYSRSIDGGNSFIEPVNLSNSINDSMDAKIELWGARSIAVVFSENNDIYYTSSVDGGISFSPPEDISNNPETLSTDPNIDFADNAQVKIIWIEHDLTIPARATPVNTNNKVTDPITKIRHDDKYSPFIIPAAFLSKTTIERSPAIVLSALGDEQKPTTLKSAVMMGQIEGVGKSFVMPRIVTSDPDLEIHTPAVGTTPSGKVYLCYVKGTEDNTDIFCNRSDDNGATFGNSTDLTKNPGFASFNPKLSVSGDYVHLVWSDLDNGTDGNLDVFSMFATDSNGTFTGLTNLSNDTAGSVSPDISSSGNILHAVWGENTPGNNAIFVRNSKDGGQTFDNKILIGNNDSMTFHPSIASSGEKVIVATTSSNDFGNQDIIIQKSIDGGKSFEKTINLTGNNTIGTSPITGGETGLGDEGIQRGEASGEGKGGEAGRNNNPPVAIASASTTNVGSNRVVVLDASRSIDPDGESITYKWEQISGFEVKEVKSNPSTSVISFIAPGPIVSNGTKEGETGSSLNNTLGFQVTVEDKHGAKAKSRVNVFVSDAANPEVQVKLVGPSTPPFRGDIVELKTQIIGMQLVPSSYLFSEKSGPQAITIVTDSETQFDISQGDYETSDPDIKVQMPSDCKASDSAIPESERYVFEVRLNDTNNREYAAESTVDLICPQFIIEPSNNTIGLGETLTMEGKLTGFHKDQNYSVSIFSRQMGQNLRAGNSCLDSSCNPPFKEFVVAGDPCDGNTEKIDFTGFVVPENQPKMWVQHDVAVAVSCIGIQPQNHPPVVNQLPTFETEVNKEIVITLSGYDPDEEENENLTAIEHSKPQHGDLNHWQPVAGEVTYTPHQNYEGPDSFTFKVKDMHGLESENEGKISIIVKSPVNSSIAGGLFALPELKLSGPRLLCLVKE